MLQEYLRNITTRTMIWTGDWNLHAFDGDGEAVRGVDERFMTFFEEVDVHQMVKQPTRGDAVLDLILTNIPIFHVM